MRRKAIKSSRANGGRQKARLRRDNIPRELLARELRRQLDRFGLTRRLAAVAVDDAETQISRLMHGHFREFSADRLVGMLHRLGSNVTITIRHSRRLGKRGCTRVDVVKIS